MNTRSVRCFPFCVRGTRIVLLGLLLSAGCGSRPGQRAIRDGLEALRSGHDEIAIRHLRNAIRHDPASAPLHYHLGTAYWRTGNPDAALEAFNVALQLEPDHPEARLFTGYLLARRNSWTEARSMFEYALQHDARQADVLTAIAVTEMKSDRPQSARQRLLEALELDPDYAPALYNLASLHRDAFNDTARARDLFTLFLRSDADPVYRDKARASLQRLAPSPPSVQQTASPPETTPVPPPPRRTLADQLADAHHYRAQGLAKDAEKAFSAITAMAPDHFEAWFYLGITRHEQQDLDGARDALRKAVALRPDNPDAAYRLAVILRQHGKAADAMSIVDTILRHHPNYANAYLLMAYLRNDQGNVRAARGHLSRFIELTPPGRTREQAEAWLRSLPNP